MLTSAALGYPRLTLRIRLRCSPFKKATSTSTMSWGLPKANSISHCPPPGTMLFEHDHLDSSSSSSMPSWAREGRQPSSPQPMSPLSCPGRSSKAVAVTATVVLVPTSTYSLASSSWGCVSSCEQHGARRPCSRVRQQGQNRPAGRHENVWLNLTTKKRCSQP